MGRKPFLEPIEKVLRNGSRIHWDDHQSIYGKKQTAFRVTCGICGESRYVGRAAILEPAFTGVCRHCNSSQNNPPPPCVHGKKKEYARMVNSEGYISLALGGLSEEDFELASPMGQKNCRSKFTWHKRVLEHRLVMARHLGRPLTKDEVVHHLNGDKTDNRLENLELRETYHGKGQAAGGLHAELDRLKRILDEHHIEY